MRGTVFIYAFSSSSSTLEPKPAREIIKAGEDLKFRDFLTVALVVDKKFAFPDNWVYIHEPHVRVGRVQNYGSWSPYLVKEGKHMSWS